MDPVIKEVEEMLRIEPQILDTLSHISTLPRDGIMRPQRTIGFLSCHYTADCGGSIGYCTVVEDRPRLHGSPITLH